MKCMGLHFLVVLAWALSFGFPTQTYGQHPADRAKPTVRYTLTDLGTLGGTISQALGMNDKGWVVGYSTTEGDAELHAFLWRHGVMTDLGTLGGSDSLPISMALSINNNGEIAGFSETSTADPSGENFCGNSLVCLPVVWRHGVMTTLPILGGNNGVAIDIDERGDVGGRIDNSEFDPACDPAFTGTQAVWEKGRVHELPTIPGDTHGNIDSINDKGVASGFTFDCKTGSFHPVLWQKGEVTDITVAELGIEPVDINNKGVATGTGGDANGVQHAFVWKNGVVTILETLPDTAEAHGNSINDKGQVAGQSCSANGWPDCTVFIWQNGVVRDLNALATPGSSLFAVDPGKINARGQIVGVAFTDSGDQHGFLATPCDQENTEDEGCSKEQAISVNASPVRSRRSFSVPEKLPPILRQRLAQRNHRTVQPMK